MLPFPATANIISRYIICNCLVILTFMFFVKQFERQNYSLEYFTLIIILIIVIKRNSDAAAVWYVSSRSYCNLQRLYIYMHSVGSNSSMPSSTIRTTSYFPSHETCSIATFNTRWSYDVGEQSLQILDYRSAHHSCADKRSLIIQTLHTNDRSLRLSNSCAAQSKCVLWSGRVLLAQYVTKNNTTLTYDDAEMHGGFLLHKIC